MSFTHDEIIAYLDRLSPDEFAEIIEALHRRLGHPPPPPRPHVTMGVPITEIGQPTLSVRLISVGPDRLAVIRVLRRHHPQMGLGEARTLVEAAPVVLWEDLTLAEGIEYVEELTAAGARAEKILR